MAKQKTKYKTYTEKELMCKRDADVVKEFSKHTRAPNHLDSEYVVYEILQPKYYISPRVIWEIIRGSYKKKYHEK